jgi:hypothetical protein
MTLPDEARRLIGSEVSHLNDDESYDLAPRTRTALFESIGPSTLHAGDDLDETMDSKRLPALTAADRVRARSAMLAAQHVSTLWDRACAETNLLNDLQDDTRDSFADHQGYLLRMQASSFEDFSVYDVPRAYVPIHILVMADLAMRSRVGDHEKFLRQVGEWWQIYPSPRRCHREFSIKWAAQEALYLAVLRQHYLMDPNADYNIHTEDVNHYAYCQTQAPAGYAMLAYAGVFDQEDKIVDPEKRRKFWLFWLTWAIPTADKLESG